MKAEAVEPRERPQESFAALAAAVHPSWHQAVIRLANAAERISKRMEVLYGKPIEPELFVHACRALIRDLIEVVDSFEDDPDLEPSFGYVFGHEDECEPSGEDEPSLGSFDRMTDQEKSWRSVGYGDLEVDDCDCEDDDPAEDDLCA